MCDKCLTTGPKPLYEDFTLQSPWVGKVRYFFEDGKYYKETTLAVPPASSRERKHEVPKKLYDAAWRIANA